MVKKNFYLKLLMSLLLVALAVPQGKAETLTVANGTTGNAYVPCYGSYFDSENTVSQTIYSSSQLANMTGVNINSITYYSGTIPSKLAGTVLQISLKEVSQSIFEKTPESSYYTTYYNTISDLTICGTYSIVGGETQIVFNFDEPFAYSGNNNLAIEVKVVTPGSWADFQWLGEEQTNGDVSYYSYGYSSNITRKVTNFVPKTTFTYEAGAPKPEISATPASLNFSTEVGTPVTNNLTVSGTGLTGNISAEIVDDANNAYSIDVNSITATGGNAQGTITVTYNPSAAGTNTATLRLTSNGATAVDVPLTGIATASAVPTIVVNPATLNINATVGETKTATFTATGTDLTGDITVAASEGFTVSPTTISAADAANGATVTVSFTPSVAGSKTGTITLTSTGATPKTVNINATATEAGTEVFTVDKDALDFGNVMLGQSKTLSVKITNKTNDNINPVFTFNNNVFSVEEDSYPVYGGLSQTYNIVYTPQAAGTDYGTLIISVGRNSVIVDLTGNCVEQAAYDITSSAASGVHNFGDAWVGGNATWNVTLTNKGANAVTPVIEWPENVEGFSAENVPASIPAGESATLTFNFAPTEIKAYGPTSIVVKFSETEDFQFDYTLRGNGIENTGTLPPSTFDNYSYTWTDKNGDEHTSLVSEIATDPDQMIALMREVYTNKNFPGPYYRGYKADGTVDTSYPVVYPAIGTVTRYGAAGVDANYTYHDTFGWGIAHDQANYPFDVIYTSSSSTGSDYKALNANEYKPNTEGLTLLLVEMKDGVTSQTVGYNPENSSLRNIFDKMFKSVRVITNSKKVTKNGVDGTLFKVDCDKMNRFFFLGKGRLRILGNVLDDHRTGRSNLFIDRKGSTSSSTSITNQISDKGPFYEMFEQFSPVSLIDGTESKDVYQQLINMQSYAVEHDCEYIPWATSEAVTGHEFNMYGKTSISDDCQDVRDLMFFVPDKRMMDWDERDKSNNDMFVNYYKQNAPTMGLYVIRQEPITGVKIDGQDTYRLHLTWDSNLTDFVPSDKGVYYIYQVNDNGTYTKVGETDSQTKELYLNVNMAEHGQQVTYVIQGRDNTGFLSLQYSNEESFIIPGTNPYEKFQLEPNANYYSRFNPADGYNYYANGLQIKNYVAGLSTSDLAGKKLMYYRQALNQSTWTKVAEVEVSGTTGTATMFEQRAQSDYKFGNKTNPELVVSTTGDYYNFGTTEKPFMVYDNLKDDVSLNIHPDGYRYKVVVDGTPDENEKIHSNVITIRVLKTDLSAIRGTFTEAQVNNELERTLGIEDPSFDIEVQQSSKTDILRYDAYRWGSEEDKNIIDPSSSVDNEQDIAPNGIAGNQGEYYTVAMNGDAYKGEDVYFNQSQTAQATFVDNVPLTTTGADEYTYAPVVEAFAPAGWGRDDYNTYGGPQHTTATGEINVIVNKTKSEYTWEANSKKYRYYTVRLDVDELNVPAGYEIAKVRAWRKIDRGNLGEKPGDYFYRTQLDGNGEKLFDETGANVTSLGGEEIADGVFKGTFGALDVETFGAIPMEFYVRMYFKKSNGSKAAGDEYYITELKINNELNSQIPTSIFGVESYKVVTGIKYYNLAGVESDVPFQGVNIEVTTYEDGSRTTRKIMK